MNKAELRAACVRIAPDFKVEHRMRRNPKLWRASCVYRGEVLELTMEDSSVIDVERAVLEMCLADLRRRETTRAA